LQVRRYEKKDTKQIINLFRETVININIKDYSKEQVDVWANGNLDEDAWENRLATSNTYVAVKDEKIIGFGNYNTNGEVDLFYIHKDYQRQGIGNRILEKLEEDAKGHDFYKLYTEASITAKPFFEARGYKVIKQQTKKVKETDFINYKMKKDLTNLTF
jgi:putative acetyltransferase